MKKFVAVIVSLLLFSCKTTPVQKPEKAELAPANEELSLDQVCAIHTCRKNVRVNFRTEQDPVDETLDLYWPRVLNGVISVLPGESFFVEADLADGKLTNLREVPENNNPDKTITIKMTQMEGDIGMMLSVYNPFEGVVLKFNMDMIDFSGRPHQTSSCPIMPKAFIFESWPHPIPEMIIKNPVVMTADKMDSMACVY